MRVSDVERHWVPIKRHWRKITAGAGATLFVGLVEGLGFLDLGCGVVGLPEPCGAGPTIRWLIRQPWFVEALFLAAVVFFLYKEHRRSTQVIDENVSRLRGELVSKVEFGTIVNASQEQTRLAESASGRVTELERLMGPLARAFQAAQTLKHVRNLSVSLPSSPEIWRRYSIEQERNYRQLRRTADEIGRIRGDSSRLAHIFDATKREVIADARFANLGDEDQGKFETVEDKRGWHIYDKAARHVLGELNSLIAQLEQQAAPFLEWQESIARRPTAP